MTTFEFEHNKLQNECQVPCLHRESSIVTRKMTTFEFEHNKLQNEYKVPCLHRESSIVARRMTTFECKYNELKIKKMILITEEIQLLLAKWRHLNWSIQISKWMQGSLFTQRKFSGYFKMTMFEFEYNKIWKKVKTDVCLAQHNLWLLIHQIIAFEKFECNQLRDKDRVMCV